MDFHYTLPFPGVKYDPFYISNLSSVPANTAEYMPELFACGPNIPGWGGRAWNAIPEAGFDIRQITHVVIRFYENTAMGFNPYGREIRVTDIRPVPKELRVSGIVSPFGEMNPAYWSAGDTSPHFVTSTQQLVDSKTSERAALEASIAASDFEKSLDPYRGYATGPTGTCSPRVDGKPWDPAYFCLGKINGRWVFLTPNLRKPYFFTGVSSVHHRSNTVQVSSKVHTTRSTLFQALPDRALHPEIYNSFGTNPDGDDVDFFRYNLKLSFPGKDLLPAVREHQMLRMKGWGFTGLAFRHVNWIATQEGSRFPSSESHFIQHVSDMPRMRVSSQDMPDVFHPNYAKVAERTLCRRAVNYDGQPGVCPEFDGTQWREGGYPSGAVTPSCLSRGTCLFNDTYGVAHFIDNELLWSDTDDQWVKNPYFLPSKVLAQSGTAASATKRAFIEELKKKYATPTDWGTAWNLPLSYSSWEDAFSAQISIPNRVSALNSTARSDLDRLMFIYAEAYFRQVSAAFRKYFPKHMYFGPRFAGNYKIPDPVIEASKPYVDGMSINFYTDEFAPPESLFGSLARPDSEIPLIFTEFHWTATQGNGGTGGALFWTPSLEKWGESYQRYLRMSYDLPHVVGTHYYRYQDENFLGSTGRGEAGSIGLVTIADQPRAALIARVTEVNRSVYSYLSSKFGWSGDTGGGDTGGGGSSGSGSDPADVTPPIVSLTSPANLSQVAGGSRITIAAQATDDRGLSSVAFYVNGSLVATDSNAPYSYIHSLPKAGGKTYSIHAIATDTSGNTTRSASVSISTTASTTSKAGGGKGR